MPPTDDHCIALLQELLAHCIAAGITAYVADNTPQTGLKDFGWLNELWLKDCFVYSAPRSLHCMTAMIAFWREVTHPKPRLAPVMTTPFELAVVQMPLLPGRKTAACLLLPCMTPCLGEMWHLSVGHVAGSIYAISAWSW